RKRTASESQRLNGPESYAAGAARRRVGTDSAVSRWLATPRTSSQPRRSATSRRSSRVAVSVSLMAGPRTRAYLAAFSTQTHEKGQPFQGKPKSRREFDSITRPTRRRSLGRAPCTAGEAARGEDRADAPAPLTVPPWGLCPLRRTNAL